MVIQSYLCCVCCVLPKNILRYNRKVWFGCGLWMYTGIIIAEGISVRHWIADCGPEIGSHMYVYMYVCPSCFWNAIKDQHMHDGNSICTSNMHAYSPPCVRTSACMHACTAAYTWIYIRPK